LLERFHITFLVLNEKAMTIFQEYLQVIYHKTLVAWRFPLSWLLQIDMISAVLNVAAY
jgi:hypothetical protein